MEDALTTSLGRLQALAAELGPAAGQEQLHQLRGACAAALATVGPAPGAAQQKALWSAAAGLWVSKLAFEWPPAARPPWTVQMPQCSPCCL